MSDQRYVADGYYAPDDYVVAGVYVDWATKVIFIPRESMTLVQQHPTEIRRLDSNDFRLTLKDLEDDPVGMAYQDTHRHNTTVLLGGIEYARIIEILAPYTITFEDGRYAVQISGSNNNIGDRVNVNNVSVRSANSAGLIQTREIEFNTFNGGITIDQLNGVSGQNYPTGTPLRPVNNISDARFIAASRGFSTIYVIGDLTLDTGDDVSGMMLMGNNASRTYIQINPGADTTGVEIREATVTGTLDGTTIIRDSYVFDLSYVTGFLFQCQLAGTIVLGGVMPASIMQCYGGSNGVTIDMNGEGHMLNVSAWNGDITIANKSGSDLCALHVTAASVIIDSTVTNGEGIHIDGTGEFVNNSLVTPEHVEMINVSRISESILTDTRTLTTSKFIALK
jgi:hypothetical protein